MPVIIWVSMPLPEASTPPCHHHFSLKSECIKFTISWQLYVVLTCPLHHFQGFYLTTLNLLSITTLVPKIARKLVWSPMHHQRRSFFFTSRLCTCQIPDPCTASMAGKVAMHPRPTISFSGTTWRTNQASLLVFLCPKPLTNKILFFPRL